MSDTSGSDTEQNQILNETFDQQSQKRRAEFGEKDAPVAKKGKIERFDLEVDTSQWKLSKELAEYANKKLNIYIFLKNR